MEENTSTTTLEGALKQYEDYVKTSHPLEVFRLFREEAKRIAELRDYIVFDEKSVNERFVLTVLHEGIQMGQIVATVSTPNYAISFEVDSPLQFAISQFEIVIRPNGMLELVFENENIFNINPYQYQDDLIEGIVIGLLQSISNK